MRVALITGGATRLGAAMTRSLHGAGFNVMIHCNNSVSLAESLRKELNNIRPDSAEVFPYDLIKKDAAASIVDAAINAFGQLDLLVNNASSFYSTPVLEVKEQQWQEIMGCNLKAPFFLSQAATPWLRKQKGQIINLLDIYAERSLPEYSLYSLSKAALQSLNVILAKELAPDIRVNAIAPGAILWPEQGLDEERKNQIIEKIPLKKQGSSKAICSALMFLVESDYLTGQVISVDGGRRLLI